MGLRCFLLEPTAMGMVTLRRYRSASPPSSEKECPGKYGYHNASSGIIEIVDATFARHVWDEKVQQWRFEDEVAGSLPDFRDTSWVHKGASQDFDHGDPRWPTTCDYCAYEFSADDLWQVNENLLYRRNDVAPGMEQPDLFRLKEAPVGAMWFAWWCGGWRHQVGDFPIVVRCPDGHDWMPDTEDSNCTQKGDQSHFCWVLHGTPPNLTADKQGNTCGAGAGSIQTGKWHGFLRGGELVTA